jgi:inosine-uridine nucleoside N-ribohydrolase
MGKRRSILALSVALLAGSESVPAGERLPVVVDTDIGGAIDDALALGLLLVSPDCELRGVTTSGEDAHTRARIVRQLLEAAGRGELPAAAAEGPRAKPREDGQFHAGRLALLREPEARGAVDLLAATLAADPGRVTLLALGPLTSVAQLVQERPEAARQARRIVWMGGALEVGYRNAPPVEAEYNARADVDAARTVLESGLPLDIVPLDASAGLRLESERLRRVLEAPGPLARWMRALVRLQPESGPIVLFDPAAALFALEESLFRLERLRVAIDASGLTRAVDGAPNVRAAVSASPEAVLDRFVARWTEAAAADFHVSPGGNDRWSGRLARPLDGGGDGPFATLARARDAVRELRRLEPLRTRPVIVLVHDGVFEIESPLRFGPEDSGSAVSPVIYRAAPGARPVLSGGRRIRVWTAAADGVWRAELPEVRSGAWSFSQLFVDGRRRWRPRLPASGYYRVERQVPPSAENAQRGHDGLGYAPGDLRGDWKSLGDVEVVAFHTWSASRMRIRELDEAQRIVRFTGPTRSIQAWSSFPAGNRYLLDNVHDAFDAPGEWRLDRRSGVLEYRPLPGEAIETAEAVAPRLVTLLIAAGTADRPVEHLAFEGLVFAHANWTLPPEGSSHSQAEMPLGAAVEAVHARELRFDGVAVVHSGGYGIALGAGCRRVRIEGCELADLGAGGVKIGHGGSLGGAPERGNEATQTGHNLVRDCRIAGLGRLHPAAVGVWIGHSAHNAIEHNDISDLYYTGISVGWTWGYAVSLAHHNAIAWNRIHRAGQGVLSDLGGVYTLGVSPGTEVHHNVIHDIESFGYGGWGLYTDEGSSGIRLHSNLVFRTKTGAFHQHYGKENRVENNIFADSREHQLQRTRAEEHLSFSLERNIVVWKTGPLLASNWSDAQFGLERNLYWNSAGQPVTFPGGLDLEAWRARSGKDRHSLIADPLFVDPERDDYRLRPESPAAKVGFEPFDFTRAGRLSEPAAALEAPPMRAFD